MKTLFNKVVYNLSSDIILTDSVIKAYLTKFWNSTVNELFTNASAEGKDIHLLALVKIGYEDGKVISLSKLTLLNQGDLEYFITRLTEELYLKLDWYKTEPINKIVIQYRIGKGEAPIRSVVPPILQSQKYYNLNLPIGIVPQDYGLVLFTNDNNHVIKVDNKTQIIMETKVEGGSTVNYVKYYKNNLNEPLFTWIDTILSDTIVRREINKSVYLFENGVQVLHMVSKASKAISTLQVDSNINTKIITMDLETLTKTVDGKSYHIPYLLCWSDGVNNHSYFVSDYKGDLTKLVRAAFTDILNRKYRGYKIYIHNLGKFDGIFLVHLLLDALRDAKVQPLIHNGRIIAIKVANNSCSVILKDSLLMLPVSLRKLALGFGLAGKLLKGIFPYLLSNIDYEGKVPPFNLFNGMSEKLKNRYHWYNVAVDKITWADYNKYVMEFEGRVWNFRQESIKYCTQDCVTLFKILTSFNILNTVPKIV